MNAGRWKNLLLRRAADLIAVIFLLLAALLFSRDIESLMDVRSADETSYMDSGVKFLSEGLREPEWGPLYQIWYFVQSRFFSDPLDLYYFNYRALSLLFPLSFYLFLRALRIPVAYSFLAGLGLLVSCILFIWPFQSYFAAVVLFCFAALSVRFRHPINQFSLLAIGTLLAGFARPEYHFSFVFLIFVISAGIVWFLIRDRKSLIRCRGSLAAFLIILVISSLVLGNPFAGIMHSFQEGGESRSFRAFAQHFSVNRFETGSETINPWIHYEKIVVKDFPTASTLGEAVKENPNVFFWHLKTNFKNTAKESLRLISPNPAISPDTRRGKQFLVILAVLLGGFLWAKPLMPSERVQLGWFPFVIPVVISVAALPSCFLIYPRQHYLFPLLLFTLAAILYPVSRYFAPASEKKIRRMPTEIAIAGLALCYLIPTRGEGSIEVWEKDIVMAKSIRFLRKTPFPEPYRLLRAESEIECYLTNIEEAIGPWDKADDETFAEFSERTDIQVILDEIHVRTITSLIDDPGFAALCEDPESAGFSVLEIPNSGRRLLVRKSWWDPEAGQ